MYFRCVDAQNKPAEVPVENWLVEDDIYLSIGVCRKTRGLILEDIDLTRFSEKLSAFNPKRFVRATEDEIKAFKLVRGLLNELNIKIKNI